MSIIATIEKEQFKTDLVDFQVGDSVCVHTRVIEGDKERIQKYSGIVIGRKGSGINANFTVRRVSFGEGVERVFPIHSPRIAKIEVEKRGSVRRSKLNYLRDLKGKAAVTVIHNGVVLHHHQEFNGPTGHRNVPKYSPYDGTGPIRLQDHGDPVRYRNIWIRPLGTYDRPESK